MSMLTLENMQRYAFAQVFCNGKIVLDAGCKYGFGTSYIGQASKAVTGVDIDPERVQEAKKFEADNVKFFEADLQSTLNLGTLYDVCVCLEVLEHLEKPEAFLSQLRKLVKLNGIFVFSVPIGERRNVDGSRIEEHVRVFPDEDTVKGLLSSYMYVEFLGRQEPVSFIGIGRI